MSEYVTPAGMSAVALGTLVVTPVALHLAGILTLAQAHGDSMQPALSPGALFLALPLKPTVGSIVLFERTSGEHLVHGGPVTKGDRNIETDQAQGWSFVDPATVKVLPMPAGRPVAIDTPFKTVIALGLAKVALLAAAALVRLRRRHSLRMPLRASHLVVLAALALLIIAPTMDRRFEKEDELVVTSSFAPVFVHVHTADSTAVYRLGAFETLETGMQGPASVTIAPAVPGLHLLVPFGALIAFVPLAALLAAMGLWLYRRGT